MKKLLILVVLALAVVGYFGWKALQKGLTIEVSQEQLQAQIAPKFPIQRTYLVVNLTLSDPQVILKDDSDRIFIGAKASVTVPTQPQATGSTMLSGNVLYDAEQGAFLLTDLRMEDLQVPGISGKILDYTKLVLGEIGAQVLNRFPVYRLDQSDRRQQLAKSFLRSVDVSGGKLRITLGL